MLSIHRENPQQRIIDKAVEVLRKGGLIIYPTDTVYGLGADINNKQAIERILLLKQSSKNKMLSFICDDFKHMHEYVVIDNHAFKIMKRCLPGHFTFILEATKLVPKLMLTKQKTAGIRLPDDAFCQLLVKTLGNPIVSTSLPIEGDHILNDPYEINEIFGNRVDLIIDGGILEIMPSTIVDLQNNDIKIVREGSGDLTKLY
jgi:tRNA threonylcarbamoyl adenosine modification protein (Sua5/YciO/YrdC/YwlC family)